MNVMERANDIESIVILYEYKPDVPGKSHGFCTNDGLTTSGANYLIDCFKAWLVDTIQKAAASEDD